MTTVEVVALMQRAMAVSLMLVGPFLLAGLVVGVVVGLLQAMTQINEATLSFIPKLLVIGLVLLLAGQWMLQKLMAFTTEILGGLYRLTG